MSVHGDAVARVARDAEVERRGAASDRSPDGASGRPADDAGPGADGDTVQSDTVQTTIDAVADPEGPAGRTQLPDPPADDPLSGPIHDLAVGNPPRAGRGSASGTGSAEEIEMAAPTADAPTASTADGSADDTVDPDADATDGPEQAAIDAFAGEERVNAFHIGGTYFFRHYFDDDVFAALRPYYDAGAYRFAVPESAFLDLRPTLERAGYRFEVVEEPAEFVVLVPKYTDHPDNIFKASVAQATVDGKNCFVMADEAAVRSAVAGGAVRLVDSGIRLSFTDRATA